MHRTSPWPRSIAWHDTRDVADLEDLIADLGAERFSRTTGLPLWTQWSLTKHRWLTRRLPTTRHAKRRYNIAEWVARGLGAAPVTELSLASRTGWLDLASGTPWHEAMTWSGASPSMLGELVSAGQAVGRVPGDHPLGQLRGATLTIAGHDHQAAVVGAGALGDNDELDSCGTAEALLRTVDPGIGAEAVGRLAAAGVTVGWHVLQDRVVRAGRHAGRADPREGHGRSQRHSRTLCPSWTWLPCRPAAVPAAWRSSPVGTTSPSPARPSRPTCGGRPPSP